MSIKFNISKYGQKYCLNDVVEQCEISINPKEYIHSVTPKITHNGNHYITRLKLIDILEKSKAIKCKELLKLIKPIKQITAKNEVSNISDNNTQITITNPINFIDSGKNIIYFNGSQVKYFYLKEQIYFKAKDIAIILGYNNSKDAIIKNIESSDKNSIKDILEGVVSSDPYNKSNECIKLESLLGNEDQQTIFINESGLYSLILGSKKQQAKQFKHWVTSEVLP